MKNGFKFLLVFFLFFICNKVYAEPANDSFFDDALYNCIIDAYNSDKEEKKDYTYNILPEELIEITSLDCTKYSGKIENLTGLNKLISLTSINLSGNTFIGGTLKLKEGSTGTLTSNIILPNQIALSDVTYTILDKNIVSIDNGVVKGLSDGSTYVTMTAKITGNVITEKYLVSVLGTTEKSSNANLSSLSISTGELNFKSGTKKYAVVVSNSVTSVTITAKTEDLKASFVTSFGPRKVNLNKGNNTVYVKVKAEDGTINVYTIGITRSDGTDSNNLLSNIELSVGKLDFKSDVTIYTITVANDIDKLDVKAIPESLLATVEVSDTKLLVGENKITITVTAENKETKEYELIVNKEEYESTKNYLKSLTIKGYSINFSPNIEEYTLKITNDNSLKLVATTEKLTSAVSIIGNSNLKNNSKITIRVTDEDNVSRDYTIKISKLFIYDITYKEAILFAEFILIFILILIIILKPKNRKTKKKRRINKYINNDPTSNKICPKCGSINDSLSNTCYICGKELK